MQHSTQQHANVLQPQPGSCQRPGLRGKHSPCRSTATWSPSETLVAIGGTLVTSLGKHQILGGQAASHAACGLSLGINNSPDQIHSLFALCGNLEDQQAHRRAERGISESHPEAGSANCATLRSHWAQISVAGADPRLWRQAVSRSQELVA